ncbi:MAG: M23 family metallopeptidase, partial [Parcubacteria group bacterium]
SENSICSYGYAWDTAITLSARPEPGYAFSHWEENGIIVSTEREYCFLAEGSRELVPVFERLRFPIGDGTFSDRTLSMDFGANWSYGECPVGVDKIHIGIDISATANEVIKAAGSGKIMLIFEDLSENSWGWCIVIDHGQYTTTYWHLNDPRNDGIYTGATVIKGQNIGTVKYLPNNTHFHFGIRNHTYTNDNIPNAGALPVDDCGIYPAYPELFIDPSLLTYE